MLRKEAGRTMTREADFLLSLRDGAKREEEDVFNGVPIQQKAEQPQKPVTDTAKEYNAVDYEIREHTMPRRKKKAAGSKTVTFTTSVSQEFADLFHQALAKNHDYAAEVLRVGMARYIMESGLAGPQKKASGRKRKDNQKG